MATIIRKERPITESFCIRCNRPYDIKKFYKSDNPNHANKVVPYCTTCCKTIYQNYYNKYGDIKLALWSTCAEIGIPFIQKVYDGLMEKIEKEKEEGTLSSTYNYWGQYYVTFLALKKKSDKWDCFGQTDVDRSSMTSNDEETQRKLNIQDLILDWGEQSDEDYAYLEYRWGFYTDDIKLTPAQESLYRKLCIAELRYKKEVDMGNSGKEEQDMVLKLMKTLKLDNFTQKKEKTLTEQMLEHQIWEIENTEPCECEDLEKYKDFCNIEADWFKYVVSAVKNLIAGTKEYPLIPRKKD